MKINEKLTKPITEVNYLRAENVDRYRVIIRYFYEQYEKIQYWLYKEDVFEAMIQTGLFPNYTLDQCQSDLSSLTEWKNLIAIQDTSKVTSIEEFKNRKYRYQLSEYTIEIERMTLKLENLQVEGASLEPTLLERIQSQIIRIETLQDASIEEIHTWWKDLNADFIRLNQNYQDYIRTLNSAKAEEMMKTESFLLFKEKIISYLRNFVKGLQEHAMILEDYIQNIPFETIVILIEKAVNYEMSIPRMDDKIQKQDIYDNFMARWDSIYSWFVGKNGISEVNRMSDITNEIIRKITRYAQQIGELQNQGANRAEEYKHISDLFGKCQDLNQAHKMSALFFGVDKPLHMQAIHNRNTDSIDSGVYEEEITYYALEPRTRVATVKTKRQPAQDYNLEKEQQRLEILEHKQAQNEKLKSYIQDGVVDFEKIDILDGESRKILLSWLSKGLNDVSKTAKTDDGRDFYIDDSNLKTIEVKCEDGIFVMPSYRICFKR